MSDDEWNQWSRAWNEEKRPMPRIIERARSDRSRALLGAAIFSAIIILLIGLGLRHTTESPDPVSSATKVLMLGTPFVLAAGFFFSMRGTWSNGDESAPHSRSPLAMLDSLERRHHARRRLVVVAVMGLGFTAVGEIVLSALGATGHLDSKTLLDSAVPLLVTGGVAALVARRVGKKIDRELVEIEEARRLLRDSTPPAGDA